MLTECFRDVVVGTLPNGWLLASFPLYLYVLLNMKEDRLRRSWAYQAKMGLAVAHISIRCTEWLKLVSGLSDPGKESSPAHWIAVFLELVSLAGTMILVELERKKKYVTSGILTIYWFLASVCGTTLLYCQFMEPKDDTSLIEIATCKAGVACSILQFIIHCFPDPAFQKSSERQCARDAASFVSRLFYVYGHKYLASGHKRLLKDEDFDELMDEEKCELVASALVRNWEKEKRIQIRKKKKKTDRVHVSLIRTLFRTFALDLFVNNLSKLLQMATELGRHVVIGYLIGFADDSSMPTWKAFVCVGGLLVCSLVEAINSNNVMYQSESMSRRFEGSLSHMLFQKSFKLTHRARSEKTIGGMTSLLTSDVKRVQIRLAFLWQLWCFPCQIIAYTLFLYSIVGHAMVSTLTFMVIVVPINMYCARKIHTMIIERSVVREKRIRLLTEVLNGIKVLKMYAWEMAFGDRINAIRTTEMDLLGTRKLLGITLEFCWTSLPFFMAFVTLATYVYVDENHVLRAQTAFIAVSIFRTLGRTFAQMPNFFSLFAEGYNSLRRLDAFFNLDDVNESDVTHVKSDNAISIQTGQFTWNPQLGPCLNDIHLDIPKGSIVAIVGRIGCGKSSLLSAILGEMEKNRGTVNTDGTTAYVSQLPWIQNATLRDNILFGEQLRHQSYDTIIKACSLVKDLEILPAGDQTEIGEKGVNLSGGQKQRVSLARAVYSNADIYLLDDPLSAVDAHVGKHIFEHVLGSMGLLRNKTRILVTHGLTWLPYVDKVIVLENGQITEQGRYDTLMDNDGPFAKFIKEYSLNKGDDGTNDSEGVGISTSVESGYMSMTSDSSSDGAIEINETLDQCPPRNMFESLKSRKQKRRPLLNKLDFEVISKNDKNNMCLHDTDKNIAETGKLMEDETVQHGNIKVQHFKAYVNAFGVRYCVAGLLIFMTFWLSDPLADLNIKHWTSDVELQNVTAYGSEFRMQRNIHYLKKHTVIGLSRVLFFTIFNVVMSYRIIHAAKLLHTAMLGNVLRAPMVFFDRTPVGRIVHRFDSDIEPLQHGIFENGRGFVHCLLDFLTVLIVVSFYLPSFLVVIPPIVWLYYIIQNYYVPTRRQLSSMRSKRRSPIVSHFAESLGGTSVILAFSKQHHFLTKFAEKVDYYNELEFMDSVTGRWLATRLALINTLITAGTIITAIYNRDTIDGSVLGLVLGTMASLNACIENFVWNCGELERNAACLEKVHEYSTQKTEAALHTSVRPPAQWPDEGAVTITDLSLRYREGQGLVLRSINMHVQPGEKVGIVGRTGAGKTSLTVGLFRLVEACHGVITIDGLDLSDLGLFDLRSHLTILPQDPVIFSGTLKDNLDPLGNHSDQTIYDVLQHAHLRTCVEGLSDKLNYQCGEGGQNLSVGQRQLICLARSLLRKSKVLILDEATSAVDMATDELIQATIKTEFKDCTVLTIAHRLNTIIDYDRVLVLDRGEVMEFDTPAALLANPDGLFHGMAKDAGLI